MEPKALYAVPKNPWLPVWITILLLLSIFVSSAYGGEMPEISPQLGPQASPSLVFSPDSRYILSRNKLFDIETGREVRAYQSETFASFRGKCFTFSVDGKSIMSLESDRLLYLDMMTGNDIGEVKLGHEADMPFAISPDGKFFLVAGKDGSQGVLRIRDLSSGALIRTLRGHSKSITSAAFSPDGRYIVSGSVDMTVKLWELQSGRLIKSFEGHASEVVQTAFSPDMKYIVSYGGDSAIELWDPATGRELGVLEPVSAGFAFTPDGKSIFYASASTVGIWELSTRQKKKWSGREFKGIDNLTLSPDGKYLLGAESGPSGGEDTIIRVWDALSGRELRTFRAEPVSGSGLVLTGNGKHIVIGGDTLRIRDAASLSPIREIRSGPVSVLSNCPDNLHIMTFGNWREREVKLWEIDSGRLAKTIKVQSQVISIVFSSDGKHALVSEGDANGAKVVRLIDIYSGMQILQFEQVDTFYPVFAVFSQDSRFVLVGNYGTIELWDVLSAKKVRTFQQVKPPNKWEGFDPSYYTPVAVSPDGRYTISGGTQAILWNVATGEQVWAVKSSSWCIYSVGFSPDAKKVLIAGPSDHPPEVLETATGKHLNYLEKATYNYSTPWEFSPDGKYAISGVHIWELSTGRRKDVGSGARVVFSRDGKHLFKGSYGKIGIWDTSVWQEVVSLYGFRDGEWLCHTPDGYYSSSPEGSSRINWTFSKLLDAFSFEQFESNFKRADIVKARLNGDLEAGTPTPLVTPPPQIHLAEHLSLRESVEKVYPLKLTTSGIDDVTLARVFVNGKLVLGVPVGVKEKDLILDVPLFPGANRITAVAYNDRGFSSNPKYFDVICQRSDLARPNLHVVGIGISKYPKLPQEWQLSYAHSDAKSVMAALKSQEGGLFGTVNTTLVTNEEATTKQLGDVFRTLEAIGENDVAVIFLAGHGVMGQDGTFYFLTPDGSLEDPQKGGISWKDLGETLGKVKGRVILLLDACHSGNISTDTVIPNDELAHRLTAEGRSGVMVFAASKGRQAALESPDLGGGFGAFAYSVVQALGPKVKEADLNDNGFVEFMELVEYVSRSVDQETEGEQTPWLSRKELFGDFAIAAVPGQGPNRSNPIPAAPFSQPANSQPAPPETAAPKPTSLPDRPTPPGASLELIRNTIQSYYDAIQSRNIAQAIHFHAASKRQRTDREALEAAWKSTQSLRIDKVSPRGVGATNARVAVYLYTRQLNRPEEYWVATMDLVDEQGEWKIVNTVARKVP